MALEVDDVITDEQIERAKMEMEEKGEYVTRVGGVRVYSTSEVVSASREKLKTKYLENEITEAEYVSHMSQLTAGEDVARDVESMKAQKYEDLQEQYENDEITEAELESRMDRLFDSGDEFLDVDSNESSAVTQRASSAGTAIRKKLAYYSFPAIVLLPIVAVIVVPGINPMMAIVAAPTLLALGLVLYVIYWAERNL
jgi:hypothetical protein